ncbi:cobyrinate a,c-diamide synthase [Halorubrum vacuolatum]|uniref:Hydrogenobyrinic acid a,c-diamide synthase (Glutamine-hydrolysing) /cobyrinate a,c-diamide synthase n=1 Tax=Halorubrum vacuolatum TaxID=63740 RepID=A0A238X9Z2_HALVU|nr:cobyrinate a,c-diamide synthase [Halorubrum vacuolatum]SNR55442.1 hydrogenobyrinic acid a,c-diamide synthase (glutamine-hydrolysing) /cobyrinate a,c-diamide synthase [Halorubrum vacuolatum]
MEGIVIAGTASNVGKTVTTLAVTRALSDAGYVPIPAKTGPDYIDPSHHTAITGTQSRTLDTWMQGVDGLRENLHRSAKTIERDVASGKREPASATGEGVKSPIAVVEGMMGLYDGSVTSTAATAAALDVPVVLVVDAAAGMQSVGATALGFKAYATHAELPPEVTRTVDDPRVNVVGVIAARAHPGTHADGIKRSIPDGMTWLGYVPPMNDLEIPDRHLGLHMGSEVSIPTDAIAKAAETIDGEAIARMATPVPGPQPSEEDDGRSERTRSPPNEATVAVAVDEAFRFIYPATLERLRELAAVVTFAPTAGEDLPACDAVYLPGGYPESHGPALEGSPALSSLADRAADGLPILGECGGLMALVESLTTTDGGTYRMAGVLPGTVTMRDRYQALDHVEFVATEDNATATAGERHRGHEFHYSAHTFPGGEAFDVESDARFVFDMARGKGIDGEHDGLSEYRTVGTYSHRHPASGAFDNLVEAARTYSRGP